MVIISKMKKNLKNVILLAKIAEVVQSHEFLGTLSHQTHIKSLSEEEVVVLTKDATKACIETDTYFRVAQNANVNWQHPVQPLSVVIIFEFAHKQ